MNAIFSPLPLSLVLLALALAPAAPGFEPDTRPPTVARTTTFLVEGIIPHVDFEATSLEDALEYINQVTHASSNPQFGISWTLPEDVRRSRLSFHATNISPMKLIERCLGDTAYSLRIRPGLVTLIAPLEKEPSP